MTSSRAWICNWTGHMFTAIRVFSHSVLNVLRSAAKYWASHQQHIKCSRLKLVSISSPAFSRIAYLLKLKLYPVKGCRIKICHHNFVYGERATRKTKRWRKCLKWSSIYIYIYIYGCRGSMMTFSIWSLLLYFLWLSFRSPNNMPTFEPIPSYMYIFLRDSSSIKVEVPFVCGPCPSSNKVDFSEFIWLYNSS